MYSSKQQPPHTTTPPAPSESIGAKLARNVVAARAATNLTQQRLADRADVARATIAQIEAGLGDPKLSTLIQLARALQVDPLILLLGRRELTMLAGVVQVPVDAPHARALDEAGMREVRRLSATGLIRDRVRAARLAAKASQQAGHATPATVGAAIAATIPSGSGLVVGAFLAELLADGSGTAQRQPPATGEHK